MIDVENVTHDRQSGDSKTLLTYVGDKYFLINSELKLTTPLQTLTGHDIYNQVIKSEPKNVLKVQIRKLIALKNIKKKREFTLIHYNNLRLSLKIPNSS